MTDKIWTDKDYENIRWHKSILYGMYFPNDSAKLSLDIDFIISSNNQPVFSFNVAPCVLIFNDVYNLEIKIKQRNILGVEISDILMINKREGVGSDVIIHDFKIDLFDVGHITFASTGFIQKMMREPIESERMEYKSRNLSDLTYLTF